MHKLDMPPTLNDSGAIAFIRDLNEVIDIPDIALNFKTLTWVRPFGTLVSAEALQKFIKIRNDNRLSTYYQDSDWLKSKNSGPVSYLKYFGFFQYCGIPLGETVNKEYHTNTYFPIQIIKRQDLEKSSIMNNWRNVIERKCEELSELITKDPSAQICIEYALREIIRNVFEHSESSECSIMAQCYSEDEIEVAVADRGVGIHSTLSGKYNLTNPIDSLFYSIEPGVSRIDIEKSKGPWGNSGFGLFVLAGIGKEYGDFSILSSGAYLNMYREDKKTLIDETYFQGTAIKLRVKKSSLEYFPNLKAKLIKEGEEKYHEKYGVKIKASGKSKD